MQTDKKETRNNELRLLLDKKILIAEKDNTTDILNKTNELQLKAKLKKQKLKNKSNKQDINQRKRYAFRTFTLVSAYIIAVFIILFMCGYQENSFSLSDNILMILLGTALANVIGLFAFVMKYLFNTGNKNKIKQKDN
jgi:hypothetical protein